MTKECEKLRVLLHGYLDGELTAEDEKEVRDHLSRCDACATSLAEIRRLSEGLNQMSLDFGQVDVWEQVRARIAPVEDKSRTSYAFPIALVATMIAYKLLDLSVGFGVALLLKPVIVLVVVLLLALHKQNPFRLSTSLNGASPVHPSKTAVHSNRRLF